MRIVVDIFCASPKFISLCGCLAFNYDAVDNVDFYRCEVYNGDIVAKTGSTRDWLSNVQTLRFSDFLKFDPLNTVDYRSHTFLKLYGQSPLVNQMR